jgi:hypothetical protein
LIKSEDRKKDDIINRPGRSTYPREKSVLTSGATPLLARRRLALALRMGHTGMG